MEEKITIWIVTIEWQGSSSQFTESKPFKTEKEANKWAWKRSNDFTYNESDCEQKTYGDGSEIYLVTPDGYYALIEIKEWSI